MDIEHKKSYIAVIAITPVLFAGAVVFNFLASGAAETGVFRNSTGDVSNYYYLEITPAGWTFSIWGIIYAWQLLWMGYALSTVFRRCSYGYLYLIPGHLPIGMFLVFWLNLACNLSWLFLWDRFYPEFALIPIALTAFTLYVCLAMSCIALHRGGVVLIREEMTREIWLTRGIVQNGLACYAAWVSIATLLNLAVVLSYSSASVSQEVSSTVALCLLTLELCAWFMMDLYILDRYVRYILSPYLVVVMALAGSISKNWELTSSNSAFSAFLLSLACLITVLKLFSMTTRHMKLPMFTETSFFKRPNRDYGSLYNSDYEHISAS